MGRIAAPFGVKGWVKIQPYRTSGEGLLACREWWLKCKEEWQARAVVEARRQGSMLVAKLEGCDDREAAAEIRGGELGIPRAAFPPTDRGEYYWVDLIGLKVANERHEVLGVVTRVLETGANDVLVLEGERERLIPFVGEVVKRVDLEGGVIVVNWDADY